MLDINDFNFFEKQNTFDFKSFFTKVLGYWKWFVATLIIALIIAYQVNIRKQTIFNMATTVAYKEESNPFFTSNTSLVFNWGGTSDKVQTIITTLQSRSHNEMVVSELNYYIEYLKQGRFHLEDIYGEVPFKMVLDNNYSQLTEHLIAIRFISSTEYEINVNFENNSVSLVNYATNVFSKTNVPIGEFKKRFKIGEQVSLPFLHFKLELNPNAGYYTGGNYLVRFANFNNTVKKYKDISVDNNSKAGAIVVISLTGTNKARMVDYLNGTVNILMKRELQAKNQFATNTIAFIDSTLVAMEGNLKDTEEELKRFSKDKNLFEVELGGEKLTDRIDGLDIEKDQIVRKLNYYNTLKNYLINSVDYSKLPAPSVAGIDDPNIVANVSKLTILSTERAELSYSLKNDKKFRDFDIQMDALKKVLLENIKTSKISIEYDLNTINRKINEAESVIKKLPEQQQELIKINRKYDLNKNIYNSFLEKRSEADIVRAANLSDIQFIDPAKDTGDGLIGPQTSINYVLAFFIGILLPLVIIFIITLLDSTIKNTDEVSKQTNIPVIGVVGKKITKNNLAVFEKPKSTLAESFRAIRSSLQFLYKKQQQGTKTLMLTSSISGEGKTFCSINIATVFALNEKKTIILGLDLRKPKIFDDFNIENTTGVVNYLIGQKSLDEVIQKTQIPYLDLIPSGPIPPNPSELIMGESMKEMLDELKQKYDFIILDTPPVGLVTDALELTEFCDATLYVVRQNVTKKEMLELVNNKHKRGELKNISIIFNGFENKAKYGNAYGYGYGYGYGDYSNGYHENDKKTNPIIDLLKKIFKK